MELGYILADTKKTLKRFSGLLLTNLQRSIDRLNDYLKGAGKRLHDVNPMSQLKLGYSLTSIKGKVVRSVKQVGRGEKIDIRVSDGEIKSQVKNIIIK